MENDIGLFRDYALIEKAVIRDWGWEEFKHAWQAVERVRGEDAAWAMLHSAWQLRSGEMPHIQEADSSQKHDDLSGSESGMIPIERWDQSGFRAMWNTIVALDSEDEAWQVIFSIWEIRAGEKQLVKGE